MPTTPVTTELLGEHPELSHIDVGREVSGSWIRGGDGLIGFGVRARTTVTGKNRFNDARAWWKSQLASYDIRNNAARVPDQFSSLLSRSTTINPLN